MMSDPFGACSSNIPAWPRSIIGTNSSSLACLERPPRYDLWVTRIDCIAALKALGELHRLRIVRLLLKYQLGVNEISKRLRMSQYNVSKHLRVLKEAGLVEVKKSG